MKEEKRDLYRVDPLKVREKLYEMYPPGSEARKQMEKEEKLKELGRLSSMAYGNDFDVLKEAAEHLKSANIRLFIRALFFGGLGGFLISLTSLATTPIELGLVIGLVVCFSLSALKDSYYIVYNIITIKRFNLEMNKIQKRIRELKGDIFNEFSR